MTKVCYDQVYSLETIEIHHISGALSSTKFPIMSADPHLDLSKTPNTFYESVFRSRDGKNFIFGVSVPGYF